MSLYCISCILLQVLVQIKAAGVNPVDTYIRSGVYPKLPTLPYIPGKDGSGIVAAVGEGVSKVKVCMFIRFSVNNSISSLHKLLSYHENN